MDTHAKCFDGVLHPAQLSAAVRSHVMNPTLCVDLSYFFAAGGAARSFLHTNGIFTDFRNGWCACYSTVCTISLFSFDPGRRAKTLHRGSSAGFWASFTIISSCLEAVLRTGMNLKRVPCRVNLLISACDCRSSVREEYLPALRLALTAPLWSEAANGREKDGIPRVMELMNDYSLSRCDIACLALHVNSEIVRIETTGSHFLR